MDLTKPCPEELSEPERRVWISMWLAESRPRRVKRSGSVVARCCPIEGGRYRPLAEVLVIPGVGPFVRGVQPDAVAVKPGVELSKAESLVVSCPRCGCEYRLGVSEITKTIADRKPGRIVVG